MNQSTVIIECLLYVFIALFGFCQVYFGGDEAAKYLTPVQLFWLRASFGAGAAITGALKTYRSTTFGRALAEKQKTNETPTPPTPPSP